jgi:hypothetical protein
LVGFALRPDARLEEFGAFWSTVPAGLARLGFSFTAGVLIYRLRPARSLANAGDWRAWLLLAGLVGTLLAMPASGSAGLVTILAVFPAIVWFATRWELPQQRLANILGALSYPLYCIHVPILALAVALGPAMAFVWVMLVAASLLFDRYWDRPARRWLTGLRPRAAAQTRIGIST